MSEIDRITSVEYRQIGAFLGYRFGSDGTVWSEWRKGGGAEGQYSLSGQWKQRKAKFNHDGYLTINLFDHVAGKRRCISMHSLILEAFKGAKPSGHEARHLNGIRSDNRIENLEWGTHAENCRDKRSHGTLGSPEKPRSGWPTVRVIRRAKKKGVSTRSIAKAMGLAICTVNSIARCSTWKPELRRRQVAS